MFALLSRLFDLFEFSYLRNQCQFEVNQLFDTSFVILDLSLFRTFYQEDLLRQRCWNSILIERLIFSRIKIKINLYPMKLIDAFFKCNLYC